MRQHFAPRLVAFYGTKRENVETYCEKITGLNYAGRRRRNLDISEKEEREALLLRKNVSHDEPAGLS